eukprot:Skav213500  [mRNA]  locus=scaffold3849:181721:186236:+ [translate_table: standard]
MVSLVDHIDVVLHRRLGPGSFGVTIPSCGADAVLHLGVLLSEQVAKCSSVTLMHPRTQWVDTCLHLRVDHDHGGAVLLHPTHARGPFQVAELFGGLAGWSYACDIVGKKTIAIIDNDLKVCQACAKAHQTTVMTVDEFLQQAHDGKINSTVVVHGSVDDVKVWVALGYLNVSTLLISPPCQPWSSTGKQGGITAVDGAIFLTVLESAGIAKHHAVICENVPGLVKHPDFQRVVTGAALKGMKLVLDDVNACHKALPLRAAKNMPHAADRSQSRLPGPSLCEADSVHVNVSAMERALLEPSQDAIELMKRSDLIPSWLRDKVNWSNTNPVLDARTTGPNGKMSGIMARYGSQHLLPLEHLQEKGLHTTVFNDQGRLRLFSPWEVLSALGFPETVCVSNIIQDAYQQVGNTISPVHAMIQVVKTHTLLGHLSPFPPIESLENAIAKVSKRPRAADEIPSTVPFHLEQSVQGTEMLPFAPVFVIPSSEGLNIPNAAVAGGIIVLSHHHKHWMTRVHGCPDEQLSKLVTRALPHADAKHFVSFKCGEVELEWTHSVRCVPEATVTFVPTILQFTCTPEDGVKLVMNGDVTWTINTMKAYVATMLHSNVDALHIQYGELPTRDCDFLAEYDKCDFSARFKAFMPGYVSFEPHAPSIDEQGLTPRVSTDCRFTAKHPTKKVVRTVVATYGATLGDVVRAMFPDLCEQVAWTLGHDHGSLEASVKVESCKIFTIQWHCFRPLSPTTVEAAAVHSPVDAAHMQVRFSFAPQRWIKSPFHARATIMRVDDQMSLKQIAASFVVHTQLNINIMCALGGHVLDPHTALCDVPANEVLVFRFAPLLGGAKGSGDQVKQKVVRLLGTHGVSSEQVADRADAFLHKADKETLGKYVADDDESFWRTMKDEANRVRFRMVYPAELTKAKKDGRAQKPPAKSVSKKQTQAKQKDDFVATASNIKIDVSHFWDGDVAVPLLDASRFGQDQCGIAIMSCEDADKIAATKPASAEPLAVLVVGRAFAADDEPFTMPAYTQQGQPIIIRAAIRNFGDRLVSFKSAVPNMEVGRTESTVLEIHIYRDQVVAWKECSVPLHYLGVQISAVRGSSLISAWAWKSFNADRTPTPYRESAYWHGYVRVEDQILDAVLGRSGWAGIYITPKTPERKLDERFSVITIPDTNLADVQRKVGSMDKVLGIVRIRDQLGVRCRRDHAPSIRSLLLPESAYVATHAFDQEDTLWLIKNIPSEIGHQGLSQALEKSGWAARPIRAQGQNRWLVAAKQAPPAMHLCINQTFVLIEPAKRSSDSAAVTMVAKQFKVDTLVSSSNGVMQVAQTSRFQEIKTEMTEQMEAKLLNANQRIEQLQAALENVQTVQAQQAIATQAELSQVREEQAFARQKLNEVESSVVQSGQTVLQTMQSMMMTMQKNLENSMKQLVVKQEENDDSKRFRTEEPSRTDPFACKS